MHTAAFVAGELRKLGYTVTDHVGKYEDGSQAEDVVAMLENGKGPSAGLRVARSVGLSGLHPFDKDKDVEWMGHPSVEGFSARLKSCPDS